MDKKRKALVVTVAAVLLCGCPGLFSLFFGGMFALVSFIPGANIDVFGSSDPQSALAFGVGGLCVGLVFVLVAIVAISRAWRRQAGVTSAKNDSIPPTP